MVQRVFSQKLKERAGKSLRPPPLRSRCHLPEVQNPACEKAPPAPFEAPCGPPGRRPRPPAQRQSQTPTHPPGARGALVCRLTGASPGCRNGPGSPHPSDSLSSLKPPQGWAATRHWDGRVATEQGSPPRPKEWWGGAHPQRSAVSLVIPCPTHCCCHRALGDKAGRQVWPDLRVGGGS